MNKMAHNVRIRGTIVNIIYCVELLYIWEDRVQIVFARPVGLPEGSHGRGISSV